MTRPGDTKALKDGQPGDDFRFSLTLDGGAKLKPNETLRVTARTEDGRTASTNVVVVAGLEKPDVAEPREGDKTVTGSARGAERVSVTVTDHKKSFIEEKQAVVDSNTGIFVAGLSNSLAEDSKVEVSSISGEARSKSAAQHVQTSEFNWGRVRAYFSLGAVASKDDDGFQKGRPYLALNIDKSWFFKTTCYSLPDGSPGVMDEEFKKSHPSDWRWRCDGLRSNPASERDREFRQRRWYIRLNTYFEGRLQSLESLSLNRASLNAKALADKPRTAAFETGAYLPIAHARTGWSWDGQTQSLFVAPLVKGGLESLPGASGAPGTEKALEGNYRFLAGRRARWALSRLSELSCCGARAHQLDRLHVGHVGQDGGDARQACP